MLEDTEDSPIDFDLELEVDGNLLINEVCIDIDIDGNGEDETEGFHGVEEPDVESINFEEAEKLSFVLDVELKTESNVLLSET
jgi:hypothetical protein